MTEAKGAAALGVPYGQLLIGAAALATGIYGAIRGHSADQKDKPAV